MPTHLIDIIITQTVEQDREHNRKLLKFLASENFRPSFMHLIGLEVNPDVSSDLCRILTSLRCLTIDRCTLPRGRNAKVKKISSNFRALIMSNCEASMLDWIVGGAPLVKLELNKIAGLGTWRGWTQFHNIQSLSVEQCELNEAFYSMLARNQDCLVHLSLTKVFSDRDKVEMFWKLFTRLRFARLATLVIGYSKLFPAKEAFLLEISKVCPSLQQFQDANLCLQQMLLPQDDFAKVRRHLQSSKRGYCEIFAPA